MNHKKELKELIKTIKDATGLTQQKISSGAGYEKNSISQALAKKEGHEPVIKRLQLVYKIVLENPTGFKEFEENEKAKQELSKTTMPGNSPSIEQDLKKTKDDLIASLKRENEFLKASSTDLKERITLSQALIEQLYNHLNIPLPGIDKGKA